LAGGLGRSKVQRIYGFVRIKDGDLGEQLVANGLARIHGVHSAMPDGSTGQDEIHKLEQLERTAKQKKLGGWTIAGQPLKQSSATPERFADVSNSSFATPAPNPAPANGSPVEGKKSHAKGTPELGRIDVNTATEKELRMVPGIGPVIAHRIIAARPFRSPDDLKKVNGIGDKNYAKIRPYFQ
jgi:DNA uptake protein ComE-like DNA-binding protein